MERVAVHAMPVVLQRHPRARHYRLRIGRDGEVRVTMPPRGTHREALDFVSHSRAWIEEQRSRRATASGHRAEWRAGQRILFRGVAEELRVDRVHGRPVAAWGDQCVFIADAGMNLRRPVEARLVALARAELPERTERLAREHGIAIARVSVRNQASRWGSCSCSGVISLNWRLVQAPPEVRDYLIIHELMHRREMNHSIRFWRHVAAAFPRWHAAENWLEAHAIELGF